MSDALLTQAERADLAAARAAWTVEDARMSRSATAPSFLQAIAWVDDIARAAEDLDHHPDIDIRWRTITLVLSTHSAGGLTRRDRELAERIDAILAG